MAMTYIMQYTLDEDGGITHRALQEFDYDNLKSDKKIKADVKKLYEKYVKYRKVYIFKKLIKEVKKLDLHWIFVKEKVEVRNDLIQIKFKMGYIDHWVSSNSATIKKEKHYKGLLNKVKCDLVCINSDTKCSSVTKPRNNELPHWI